MLGVERFEVNPVLAHVPLKTLVAEVRKPGRSLELVGASSHFCPKCKEWWTCEATRRGVPCRLDSALDCNDCRGMGS